MINTRNIASSVYSVCIRYYSNAYHTAVTNTLVYRAIRHIDITYKINNIHIVHITIYLGYCGASTGLGNTDIDIVW